MISIDNVLGAFRYAVAMHGDQKYGHSDHPYSYHIARVAEEAERLMRIHELRFYDRRIMEAAAYLHDVIEDCGVSREVLAAQFGEEVAELVWAVSDGEGKNRRERKREIPEKIAKVGIMACVLKLADRIANVKESIATNNTGMLEMYRKEQEEFAKSLDWRFPPLIPVWNQLNQLLGIAVE